MVKQRQTAARSDAIDDFVTENRAGIVVRFGLVTGAVLEKNYCEIRERESVELEGHYLGFRTETSYSGGRSVQLKIAVNENNFYRVNERFVNLIEICSTGKKYVV